MCPRVGCLCPVLESYLCAYRPYYLDSMGYIKEREGERERVKKEENQVGKGGLLEAGKVRGLSDQHVASPYKIYKKINLKYFNKFCSSDAADVRTYLGSHEEFHGHEFSQEV